jgi:hypothetical protein
MTRGPLQALEAEEVSPNLESTRQTLFQEVGVVQLPALLMAIDRQTRFSGRLLGRDVQRSPQQPGPMPFSMKAEGDGLPGALELMPWSG